MKIIACCDKFYGFAKNKRIPWMGEDFCKIDLMHFKKITEGSVVVMGRNTYNEIAGLREIKTTVLPNRDCYVVTSDISNLCQGAITISSVDEIETDKEIFIIGGYQLYCQYIDKCDEIYLSVINNNYNCDQFFPIHLVDGYECEIVDSGHDLLKFVKYTRNPHKY